MSFTNYLEGKLLDLVFGGAAFAAPTTLYFGLSTTAPAEDGTNITEPVGNAYARVTKTNDLTNFPSANPKLNGTDITFPEATGSWGTVTHWFVTDGTNVLDSGALSASQTVGAGGVVRIPAGSLAINLD